MNITAVIEDYLLLWVLLAVALGIAVPRLAVLTAASTAILAVMIGSVSLTLSVEQFRRVEARTLGIVVAGHVGMPFLAVGIARVLGLSPALTIGFVVLGAVTPELVSPVMTELAGGDTALSATALAVVGVGSIGFVPAVVALFAGGIEVSIAPLAEELVVAVVVPMVLAVGARTRWPERVERYDDYYPSVSAVMVILIIGGVTAANADVIRSSGTVLVAVAIGVAVLNLLGYGIGWLGSTRRPQTERIAVALSVGTRDFAVAAALVVAAGLPTVASLPAVAFGIVEMTTSAALARYFAR